MDEGVGVGYVRCAGSLVNERAGVAVAHTAAGRQDPGVLVRLVAGEDHVPALGLVDGVDVLELIDDGQRQVTRHKTVSEYPRDEREQPTQGSPSQLEGQ